MQRSASAPPVRATALSAYRTTPKWSFASKPEYKPKSNQTPGPAAYNVPGPDKFGKFSSSCKFTIASAGRSESREGNRAPGPGAYTPKNPNHAPRGGVPFATTGRGDADKLNRPVSPGPAAYTVKLRPYSAHGSFPKSGRASMAMKKDAPGPGAYNPDYRKQSGPCGESTPRWSLPRTGRKDVYRGMPGVDAPGPGTYNLPNPHANTPKYSIVGRHQESTREKPCPPLIQITTMSY